MSVRRKREKVAVRLLWDKRKRDWVYVYDRRPMDGHWMHCAINFLAAAMGDKKREPFQQSTLDAFRAEMEARGFDPDTLTISVRWKTGAT